MRPAHSKLKLIFLPSIDVGFSRNGRDPGPEAGRDPELFREIREDSWLAVRTRRLQRAEKHAQRGTSEEERTWLMPFWYMISMSASVIQVLKWAWRAVVAAVVPSVSLCG